MSADGRADQIQRLFLEVTRLPVDEREPWLRRNCEDDQLLGEVRSLLRYDNLAHDPFESGLAFAADMLEPKTQNHQPLPDVDGYEVLREIGTGGQAVVYEAIQKSTTQHVALKMLRWGKVASSEERERLQREMLILARLSHPGIVSIIDSGESDSGVFFIATEFVDGPTLDETYCPTTDKSRVHGMSPDVNLESALQVFVKICKAVDAAHRAGVVHRDLKPSNILLDDQGEPHVLDFGLAKPGLRDWIDPVVAQELTISGQFMGSLPWASPEQAEGKKLDARSDIYSLGVILYQLVSGGEFPYDVSGSMSDVITQIIHGDPTPLDQLASDGKEAQAKLRASLVDQSLNAVVMKALAKSPDDRYQSAREFSEAVGRYSVGSVHVEHPNQLAERRSSQNLFIAVAVGLSVVACLAAFLNPLSKTDRVANEFSVTPPADTTTVPLEWKSFEDEWTRLADDDSVTKMADAWRLRDCEVAFPEVRSKVLLVRTVFRRYSDDSFTMRLRSRDDTEISIEVVRGRDGTDEIRLRISGLGFIRSASRCTSELGTEFEISVALLTDRVTLLHEGQLLMQVHTKPGIGPWTPVLDAREADLDCLAFEYSMPVAVPPHFTADLVAKETPTVDFIVAHGGAALSRRSSTRLEDALFQITELTTDGSKLGETVAAHEVAKIAKCIKLKRLKLEKLTEADEAIEYIAELRNLTTVEINYSQLNADCFHHFAKLGQLETLGLWRTEVKDPDFAPLQELASLTELRMASIEINDADLEQLTKAPALRTIAAIGTHVTGRGFANLIDMKNLFSLQLTSSQVSGDGVLSLLQLPGLWSLDISGSDLCDEDIPNLAKLTDLSHLAIKNTRMTTEGIERLRVALPDCKIIAEDG